MERRFIYSSGEAFQRFRMGITVGEIRLNIKNRAAIHRSAPATYKTGPKSRVKPYLFQPDTG